MGGRTFCHAGKRAALLRMALLLGAIATALAVAQCAWASSEDAAPADEGVVGEAATLAEDAPESAGELQPAYLQQSLDSGASVQSAEFPTVTLSGTNCYDYAWQVLDLVNQERAKAGAPALSMDRDLLDAAMERAQETAVIFEHTRPTGESCFTVSQKAFGENIAMMQTTPDGVMSSWMNSAGHRANILNANYKSIGIGCFYICGIYHWVQVMGYYDSAAASKASDANVTVSIPFSASYLGSQNTGTEILRTDESGERNMIDDSTVENGDRLRYILAFTTKGYGIFTPIDNSCVKWSSVGAGGYIDSGGYLTVTGTGSVHITANINGEYMPAAYDRELRHAGYWVQGSNGRWRWNDGNGGYPSSCWQLINGEWYRFDDSGYMMTGWVLVGDSWYSLEDNGAMRTYYWYVNGILYYFGSDGAMRTGWFKEGGTWHYSDGSGELKRGWQYIDGSWYLIYLDGMCTGWHKYSNQWYWFEDSGAMATGWRLIDGQWYLLSSSGAMLTGWQLYGGAWYYLNGSGAMATGWQSIDGIWYYFDGSGAMKTGWYQTDGNWYYSDDSGAMVSSKWVGDYYLQSDGSMATNRWVDGYYVGPDGCWIPNYREAS